MGWLARQYGLACDNVVSYRARHRGRRGRAGHRRRAPGAVLGAARRRRQLRHRDGVRVRAARHRHRALVVDHTFPAPGGTRRCAAGATEHLTAPRQATFTASTAPGTLTLGFVWTGDPDAGYRPTFGAGGVEQRLPMSYLELQRTRRHQRTARAAPLRPCHYLKSMPDAAVDAFMRRRGTTAQRRAAGVRRRDRRRVRGRDRLQAPRHDVRVRRRPRPGPTRPTTTPAGTAARAAAALLEPFAGGVYVNALGDEGDRRGAPRLPAGEAGPVDRAQGPLRPGTTSST